MRPCGGPLTPTLGTTERPVARPDRARERHRPLGAVAVLSRPEERACARRHQRATRAAVAERLATLLGLAFAGEHDLAARHPGPLYLVPADPLLGAEAE